MPRYYCDYCDTYLTHDSPSVRKQHNAGYKHKANIRSYYQKFEEQQTQSLIDQKIKQHLGQTVVYQQIGAAYNQHLAAYPGVVPRLPIMPSPILPPGAVPQNFPPGMRPPLQQVPLPGPPGIPGYGTAPMAPAPMQAPPVSSLPQQASRPQVPRDESAPSQASGGGPPPFSGSNMYNGGNSMQNAGVPSSSQPLSQQPSSISH